MRLGGASDKAGERVSIICRLFKRPQFSRSSMISKESIKKKTCWSQIMLRFRMAPLLNRLLSIIFVLETKYYPLSVLASDFGNTVHLIFLPPKYSNNTIKQL